MCASVTLTLPNGRQCYTIITASYFIGPHIYLRLYSLRVRKIFIALVRQDVTTGAMLLNRDGSSTQKAQCKATGRLGRNTQR